MLSSILSRAYRLFYPYHDGNSFEVSWSVRWYFEPCQPQSVISGLKTKFNLSSSYSVHKSSKHKFSQLYKIRNKTNSHITKHTHTSIKHNIFEVLVPSVLPLFKRHMKLGRVSIVDPSGDL